MHPLKITNIQKIITLTLLAILIQTEQNILLTQTSYLDAYAYFKIIIHNDLLPHPSNLTLKISTINHSNYNSSNPQPGTTIYSTKIHQQQNST